ncbi:efflux RND transporter periplasmic adaptor subunit [Bosea caraganae]|nr:efflux RND transporter periplasmic adaptor subunit [Bosea caraganae]
MVSLLAAAGIASGWWYLSQHQAKAPGAAGAASEGAGRRGRGGGADGPPVAVVTAVAEKGDFAVRKRAIGFVETPASVVVRSRIDSQIMDQHVTDGQFVKAGDLLFTLDDRDTKAQIAKDEAMIARDTATHLRTVADLTRYKQLLAKDAGTQQQVDQAIADEKSAAATVLGDQATLEADKIKLGYTKITAPIDGRIGAIQVTPGNLVGANSTTVTGLVTITQIKPIRVTFTMPESELDNLKDSLAKGEAPKVKALVPGAKSPPPVGTLNFVDSSVDQASGTIAAKAAFANDDLSLWPGQYVDIDLEAGTLKGVTIVPTVAVQAGQKGPYVYVVGDDSRVSLKQVTVALTDGQRTAISAGINPDDRVVTDGQVKLKEGVRVTDTNASGTKPGPTASPAAANETQATGDRS